MDIKLGPDGALYVADFYNKIIGHYEVDLKHPGRDHDRGRIWRIVWKGKDGMAPAKFAYADLTTAKGEDIDKLLGHPNMMVRLQATNQAIHREEDLKVSEGNDSYTAHRMWVDEMRSWRNGQSGLKKRTEYGVDQPFLASHQYRIRRAVEELLRERKPQNPMAQREVDIAKTDSHLARAAVEMMAGSPKAEFVAPLVELLKKTPDEDTHLRLAAKIALRNCLRDDEKGWARAEEIVAKNKDDLKVLLPVANGVRSKESALFLAAVLDNTEPLKAHEKAGLSFEEYLEALEFVSRYGGHLAINKFRTQTFSGAQDNPVRLERSLRVAAAMLRGLQAGGENRGGVLLDDTQWPLKSGFNREAKPEYVRLAIKLLGLLLNTVDGTDASGFTRRTPNRSAGG